AQAILPLVRAARAAGVPVVGDFERVSPGSEEVMALTDHIILPLSFAHDTFGGGSVEDLVTRLAKAPGRNVAAVTDGTAGAWWAESTAPDCVHHQPVFAMPKIVDTTGCGDVFHGVYAAGLVQGLPPAERICRAAAAAALKTQKLGAQAGAPTLEELEKFLTERR
ncbi:MAG: PfkB family carbohydrate kinase, partial [Planctomycetes bacterium]|nr:PfkB family carbohydrate kinase [Planctomycetota bacterium]